MKKCVTVIILICILLSAFAFNVSAESSAVQEAYKALSREMLTTDVYYALAENLNLDSVYLCEKIGAEGVSISWTSSDENVIDTNGKLTREKYRNRDVTLTATITDGSETLTKTFDFTVLAQSANVYFAENFYYPEYDGDIITNASSSWAFTRSHDYTETTGGMTAVITERGEDTTNYALKGYRKGNDQSIHYTVCNFSDLASGKVAWETDMYFESTDYQKQELMMFEFYGKYDNGETARIADFRFRIDSAASTVAYVYYYDENTAKATSTTRNTPKANIWNRIRVEFDTNEQVYDVYINGEKLNTDPVPFYEKNRTGYDRSICDGITKLNFGPFRTHPDISITMDDFVLYDNNREASENPEVYTVADELVFSLLSDENADEVTENLDLSLNSISSLLSSNDVSVTWESSNENVVSIDGNTAVVNRGIRTEDAVLTAKLKHSGSDYILSLQFNISVLAGEDYVNVNRVIDNVREDYFTLEPTDLISKDLDFTSENLDRFVSTDGATIEYKSDNEAVIDNTGKVNCKEKRENVSVTMTVTDNLSGYSLEKELSYTVLAKDEYVYYSSNFSYPENDGDYIGEIPNWGFSTIDENYYMTTLEKTDDGNYIQFSKRDVVNSADYVNFTTLTPSETVKNKVTYRAKFKFEHSNEKGTYMFYVNGKYKGSSSPVRLIEVNFDYSAKRTYFSFYEGDKNVGGSVLKLPPMGEWFELRVEFDVLNQSFNLYVDDVLLTDKEGFFVHRSETGNENEIIEGITNIQYNSYRYTANNCIYCDDVSLIGEKGVHQAVELFIDGVKVRNLKTMPYYSGSTLNAKQLVSNETEAEIIVTPILAVYKNSKLTQIKKGEDVTVSKGSVARIDHGVINLPDTNLENVEIKAYAVQKGFNPAGEDLIVNNNASHSYQKEEYYDETTGRTVNYTDVFGETAYKPYFNAQAWSADSSRLYIQKENYTIYEYDTINETLRYIDDGGNNFGLVTTPQNKLIYINKQKNIVEMDCETYEKRLVGVMPENQNNKPSLLTVTNDGKKLLMSWSNAIGDAEMVNEYYRDLPILDMETGEWDLSNAYGFEDNVYWNPGINPAYPNLILLNHGAAVGSTFDRNWVYNTETKSAENVFKQKPYSLTETGETHSHETWSYDGENLFIDKANGSPIGHIGVMSFDKEGKNRRHINGDYSYCHLGVSPVNKRWVVSDTAYGDGYYTNNIVLVDTHSGKSYLLSKVYQKGSDSVGHCHPAFSPDGQKVYFGMNNSVYSTFGVGYIDVSDLVNMPDELEIISLSDNCTAESYPETDHKITAVSKNGEAAYSIANGKVMYVNYTPDEIEDTEAVIEITYFDDEGSFDLCYYDWIVDTETHNELKEMSITITKENSGGWVTKRFEIEDINLENMDWFSGDFKLVPADGNLVIKSVNISINQ